MINHLKPIIFLDMDGVMNNLEAFKLSIEGIHPPGNISAMTVSKTCVGFLRKLVEDTNAEIVISSSWRSHKMDCQDWDNKYGNSTVLNALQWAGWNCKHLIIGNTAGSYENTFRGFEVNHWLENHPDRYIKGVTPFIILDDNNDFTNEQKSCHLVITDEDKGFDFESYSIALNMIKDQIKV